MPSVALLLGRAHSRRRVLGRRHAFAYTIVRPAAGKLDPPARLPLWQRVFASFLPWVAVAIGARRLGRWGARTCVAAKPQIATALLPEQHWDALPP